GGGLGYAMRPLVQAWFDLLYLFGLGDALHRRYLAREAIERRLVELTLRVGLLGLALRAIKVAHHLGDRDDVAGVDFRLVFLRATGPHGALDTGAPFQGLQRALDQRRLSELAHTDGSDLGGRHSQRHLVLDEVDDEEFELGASDLLLLDGKDLAHAMGRIDDELVGPETLTLRRLLAGHYGRSSFVRLAADRRLGPGSGPRHRTGGMRSPAAGAGCCLLGPPGCGGGGFLRPMARFSCHGFLRGSHVPG